MRFFLCCCALCVVACSQISPGKLSKLPDLVQIPKDKATIGLTEGATQRVWVQYLGCGGLYVSKGAEGILIDPFFSNQKLGRILAATLSNRRKLRADPDMVAIGLQALERQDSLYRDRIKAIFSAHAHYDHLLDIPAVYAALRLKPMVYANESGQQVCASVIDSAHLKTLEPYQSAGQCVGSAVQVGEHLRVYPILAKHNPHSHNIKFFEGSVAHPVTYFKNPYDKTKANDWLEGNTFSFLIDCLDAQGKVALRLFVQSSSCAPAAGIPPASLLKERDVDVAFLGVASHEASPFYPDQLIEKIKPQHIVWIHWEDFFRPYDKKTPKTVRGTDVAQLFQKKTVQPYQGRSLMPWPRTLLEIKY